MLEVVCRNWRLPVTRVGIELLGQLKTLYRHISHFVTNELDDRERRVMNPHQVI